MDSVRTRLTGLALLASLMCLEGVESVAGQNIPAHAANPPAERPLAALMDDLRLETAVRLAMVGDPRTRPLNPEVDAEAGIVTVTLGALSEAVGAAARDVAERVDGVRRVTGLPEASARQRIPARSAASATVTHTVRRGETLSSLARRYGTTISAIQRLNELRGTVIRVGQRLRIR